MLFPTWYPLVWISQVRTGGMTCRGYDNATVSIRFPDGAGWGWSVLLLPEQFHHCCRSPPKQLHAWGRCEQSWVGHLFHLVSRCFDMFQPWCSLHGDVAEFFYRLQCLSEVSTQLHHLEFHYPNSKWPGRWKDRRRQPCHCRNADWKWRKDRIRKVPSEYF